MPIEHQRNVRNYHTQGNCIQIFQLRQQLYKLQCLSVGLSISLSVGLSVYQQRVLYKRYAVGSVYMLLSLLQLRLLDHSVVILCNLSCDSSSIGCNVSWFVCLSATSFMEVLCCYQCIIVVTVVVVYDIRTFCRHILHFKLHSSFTSHNVSS